MSIFPFLRSRSDSGSHDASVANARPCEAAPFALEHQPERPSAGRSRGELLRFPRVDPRCTVPDPAIVAASPEMQRVLAVVNKVARKCVPVLVIGETGTGKEVVASSLHSLSDRRAQPLVRVNCAALPRELVEAELFGHTRGAFTGAVRARPGFFGAAHHGTLVLDEVEALSWEAQAKLLRAVQQGEVQTVGADRVRRVDVRVVACTNLDLAAEVNAGRFRQDLYHRLAVIRIVVPPLRERPADIVPLVFHFLREYASRFGIEPPQPTPELLRAMQRCPWPGNVRELENSVAAMVALLEDGEIGLDLLPPAADSRLPTLAFAGQPSALGLRAQVKAFEREVLRRALAECSSNRSEVARRLKISRTTLLGVLRRHGLEDFDPAANGDRLLRHAEVSPPAR